MDNSAGATVIALAIQKGNSVGAANYADVVAGVGRTIAEYCQALDDGRAEDVVATFCSDGVIEIAGRELSTGHDALRNAYASYRPERPQRHIVLNTMVVDWSSDRASTRSDLLVVGKGEDGWKVQLVGRYRDSLRFEAGQWRFSHRQLTFQE